MSTIGSVMNRGVRAIRSDATVREAIEFLTRLHIGGAPVVDSAGQLVGMISELALIDIVFDRLLEDAPIARFMTMDVHTVSPYEELSRAAQLFALYAFRRLPVVEDGKLVGVITRRDLMYHVISTGEYQVDPLMIVFPALTLAGESIPQETDMQIFAEA